MQHNLVITKPGMKEKVGKAGDAMMKDARATLEKVAQAGYVNVESAGYNNGKFYNL